MNRLLAIISLAAFGGCSNPDSPRWVDRHVPATNEERAAIAKHVEAVMCGVAHSLSGDDQDLEDMVKSAHREARISLCQPTMWERVWIGDSWHDTGRWRYAEEAKKP